MTDCCPPEIKRSKEQCCADAKKANLNRPKGPDGKIIYLAATIVCCDCEKVTCLFTLPNTKTEEGKEIISRCTTGDDDPNTPVGHEEAHMHHGNCNKDEPLYILTTNNPAFDGPKAECEAYTAERNCLELGRDGCSTDECRRDVDKQLRNAREQQQLNCKKAFGDEWPSMVPWIFLEPPYSDPF